MALLKIALIAWVIFVVIYVYIRPKAKNLSTVILVIWAIPTLALSGLFVYHAYLSTMYYVDGVTFGGRRVENVATEQNDPTLCLKVIHAPYDLFPTGGTKSDADELFRNSCFEHTAVKLQNKDVCNYLSKESTGLPSDYEHCVDKVEMCLKGLTGCN